MNYAKEIGAFQIGELLDTISAKAYGDKNRSRKGRRRDGDHVRANSKEAGGTVEKAFMAARDKKTRKGCWHAVNLAFEKGRHLRVQLRKEPREATEFERACMSITNSAVRVYKALLRMEERFRGNVIPSYEMIADWAVVSRASVGRAIKALGEIGLLARLRRYIRHITEEGARSEQTSNAYRIDMPRELLNMLERHARPAPVPDDEAERQRGRLEETAWMLSRLSKADYIRETTSDKAMAETLIRLWEGICARDGEVLNP